ncbi:hypothetical protein RFI_21294 [Reticulomyxa filosa]|uniref:Uncharacterized protein n=1 Tax=Reticulomyxa filosa TaxID=46433 RepID=X6MPY0_RETFI|nr:hypothetical protein RFI_21294 [Reticulomyxa filosa]|eukprot:ETO16063.1 hypothetical protein RFI_21294 [Reticulomyxa filosa]
MYQYISQILDMMKTNDSMTENPSLNNSSSEEVMRYGTRTEKETSQATTDKNEPNVQLSAEEIHIYLVGLLTPWNKLESRKNKQYKLEDVETIVLEELYRSNNGFGWLFGIAERMLSEDGDEMNSSSEKKTKNGKSKEEANETIQSKTRQYIIEIILRYMFYCVVRPHYGLNNKLLFESDSAHLNSFRKVKKQVAMKENRLRRGNEVTESDRNNTNNQENILCNIVETLGYDDDESLSWGDNKYIEHMEKYFSMMTGTKRFSTHCHVWNELCRYITNCASTHNEFNHFGHTLLDYLLRIMNEQFSINGLTQKFHWPIVRTFAVVISSDFFKVQV